MHTKNGLHFNSPRFLPVVSLIDGKLLAQVGGGGEGGVLYRVLYKVAPPSGPTSYPFINDSW